MTLRTRNRTLIIFICLSFLCLAASFATFITSISTSSFENIFGYKFFSLSGFSLIKPSANAVILALLFLQIYIPITALFMYFNFEKTQSTLIILFSVFLLGCQMQMARLFIALLNYKQSFSLDYLILGKISFMGKLLTIASFFLIAAESKNSKKLNIEIDIFILIIVCLIITFCIPLKTAEQSINFGLKVGYIQIIVIFSVIVGILTALTFVVSYIETEDKIIIKMLLSYLHIIIGFFMMSSTNILAVVIAGFIALSCGTYLFVDSLHKMYLWD